MLNFLWKIPTYLKAIAAFLGSLGITIPWNELFGAVDWPTFLHVLGTKGLMAAVLSLIPAILTYIAKNKGTEFVPPGHEVVPMKPVTNVNQKPRA